LENIKQEREDLKSKLSLFKILGKEKKGNLAVDSDLARAS
jgi:hypothetical protein